MVRRPDNGKGQRKREMILAAHDEAVALDEVVRAADGGREPHRIRVDLPGYEIIRELHRGTQGVVYLALQQSTKRQVAIKVLRDSRFAGSRDVARFEREIYLHSHLRHPNIVAVYDSGEIDGCFYYIMDYVSGQPFDDYIRERNPSIRQTLELFAIVCDAANAAHLRGIIHRDLKPSNVLIDENGQPRVLDFGLAKSTDAFDADHGCRQVTATGQFVGSLQWASPEQAKGQWDRVDVRSDVYSLGVMLYQALVGQYPYDLSGALGEVLGRISTAEPVRPSTIHRNINTEVETIVLRCLSKDRERRYQSAGELARDIRRYLAGEPIEAKRDSTWYLLRKMMRRHRVAAGIVIAFLVVIAGGIAGTVHNAQIAQREQQEAERQRDNALAVSGFLKEMLSSADPAVSKGQERSLQDMLDIAVPMVDEYFAGRPLLEADVRHTLGETYLAAGDHSNAVNEISKAIELYEEHAEPGSPKPYRTRMTLAEAYRWDSNVQRAHEEAEIAVSGFQRTLGPRHPETLNAQRFLADWDAPFYEPNEDARLLLEQTLQTQREVLEPDDPNLALTMRALSDRLLHLDNARAESLLTEALSIHSSTLGENHPETLRTKDALARHYTYTLRFDEALELRMQVYDISRELYADHIRTADAMLSIAWTYATMGRYDLAKPWWQRCTEMRMSLYGDYMQTQTLGGLIFAMIRTGELDRAESRIDELHGSIDRALMRALIAIQRGNPAEVERLMRPLLEIRPRIQAAPLLLGEALRRQGRFKEAEKHLLDSWPQHDTRDYFMRNLLALFSLTRLYEQWNATEPTPQRAQQAENWRKKYEEYHSRLTEAGARVREELEL